MYVCKDCGFESEVRKIAGTKSFVFIGDQCRTCYYRDWSSVTAEDPFNCTQAESHHYEEHNYDPQRVQDVLLQGLSSHR